MGAAALPFDPTQRFQWPRVAAWSGTLSLHFLLVALLLVPPTAATLMRPPPEAPMVVTSYVIPPPSPPIPPDPQPQPIQHPVKTPPSTPTHVADVRPPVSDVPSNIPIADSRPAEPTAPPSAPVEVAPSPLAYGSRTRVPYPIDAARRHEHGTVVLRVLVGTDGRPQTVEIESSSGSPRLDTAARTAVAQWTFKAGTRDGLAYAAWARVPITFDLQTL